MSTSPSWFDQEKFSRLVKKVGPKAASEAVATPTGAEVESRQATQSLGSGSSPMSTAHISLVSKPPSLLSEHRALPALPRRTAQLPALKALFQSAPLPFRGPGGVSALEEGAQKNQADSEDRNPEQADASTEGAKKTGPLRFEDGEDLAALRRKVAQLDEELARATEARDQAVNEGVLLREQLRQADEALESQESGGASSEDVERLTKERDAARAEANTFREQLRVAQEAAKDPGGAAQAKEIGLLTTERDDARRDYAKLREQFETLKREQASPKEESGKSRSDLEQQLEGFRQKLEDRNREFHALKASVANGGSGAGGATSESSEEVEKLRQEMAALREQLTRAKEETSIAQRGLALSQKALHETRDTLREATEGTSLSRHNFDNLKNECTTLVQQNLALQAQVDQLTRELGATKSKLTTRL